MPRDEDRLNDEIRELMKTSSASAVEIAKACGAHPVNVRQFKGGTRTLPLPNLRKLAAFLGYEIILRKAKK